VQKSNINYFLAGVAVTVGVGTGVLTAAGFFLVPGFLVPGFLLLGFLVVEPGVAVAVGVGAGVAAGVAATVAGLAFLA
jgi:hypothetical protein